MANVVTPKLRAVPLSFANRSRATSCLGDAKLVKQIQEDVFSRGAKVNSFPKVTIGGWPASEAAQDETSFKKALCKHGVEAAC